MNTGSKNKIPLIVLFGPTGVGKTGLIPLVFSDGFEIINADSMQVYRGMDIGSAKPPHELKELIPHHLVDFMDPREQFNAGLFVHLAEELVDEIRKRGNIPVLCGGTAFYLRTFLRGIPDTPKCDERTRTEIRELEEEEGIGALYRRLAAVDPVTARKIHPNDRYRIKRALEVYKTAEIPLSEFGIPEAVKSCYDPLLIGLERERQELYDRIDQRVEKMFDSGLVEEVRGLIASGIRETDPAMKGIGYREFFFMAETGEHTLADIKELIKRNSRRYAKRQLTFFKSFSGVRWFSPEDVSEIRKVVEPFGESYRVRRHGSSRNTLNYAGRSI